MGSNGKTPLDDWRFDGSGRFKIAKADPAAKPCTTGTKAGDIARLAELSVRLDTLQDILYAEHHRKLLVVLQGMDTSGKDGTVRGVFRAFDPLGLRVAGFKAPTPQNWRAIFSGACMPRCRRAARSSSSTAATTKTC